MMRRMLPPLSVLDLSPIVDALKGRRIAGAALDVRTFYGDVVTNLDRWLDARGRA